MFIERITWNNDKISLLYKRYSVRLNQNDKRERKKDKERNFGITFL